MFKKTITIVLISASISFAQTPSEMKNYFQLASQEFNVPASILESIGYTQTRWVQIKYTVDQLIARDPQLQPPVYGVMALRDDDWFGHSLINAANLIGVSPQVLKDDPYQNIRAAAALLSEYRDEAVQRGEKVTQDPSTWSDIIARFSGIPQADISTSFAYHVLEYLKLGISQNGINIPAENIDLSKFPESVKDEGMFSSKQRLYKTTGADYPGAVWDPSPNFSSRNGAPIVFVIIHDTEGPFDASVSWLKNSAAQASAHYIIRSSDGFIKQLVHETDKAWHVVCWNPITIGIEHEGYVNNPSFFTETMYESSARLAQYLCNKWKIPEDSLHVFGHNAWTYPWFNLIPFSQYTQYVGPNYATCNTHTDPGQYWNWHHYFDLIHSNDTTRPVIVSAYPKNGTENFAAYDDVTVTFNVPMDPTSTVSAFSITPAIGGGASMNTNLTQLTFSHPNTLLAWSTKYTVKIDTTVGTLSGVHLSNPLVYSFTTVPIDTSGPALIAVCPPMNGHSIPQAYVEFLMNEPVQYNSLPGRISLVGSNGQKVAFYKDQFQVAPNGKTIIAMHTAFNLTPGMKYTATLSPGLQDYYGNTSYQTYSSTFVVDPALSTGGNVLDNFENQSSNWGNPLQSPGTRNVDTTATSFSITSSKHYSSYYSGMLSYGFDSLSGGECRLTNNTGIDIDSSASIGMWVFGDNSGNVLEFAFSTPADYIVPVDTLNWYGWKFENVSTKDITSLAHVFKGIVLVQTSNARLNYGNIYLDDLQTNGIVFYERALKVVLGFDLLQNYPNPFNPSTKIVFSISKPSQVRLEVYDVLGRKVATLVDSKLAPGTITVNWNATSGNGKALPAGVYFYRLTDGNSTSVKKMILVK